jgi:outer membrane lipoprotein LolB
VAHHLRRWRDVAVVVVAATLLAACASLPGGRALEVAPAAAEAVFAVDGRLSARRGGDGVAVGFSWRHDPPRDTLTIANPLGQVLAELEGDTAAHRVAMTLADGRVADALDWPVLTERVLGFALPVEALAAWVRGRPQRDRSPPGDASGRVVAATGRMGRPAIRTRARPTVALSRFDVEWIVIDRWPTCAGTAAAHRTTPFLVVHRPAQPVPARPRRGHGYHLPESLFVAPDLRHRGFRARYGDPAADRRLAPPDLAVRGAEAARGSRHQSTSRHRGIRRRGLWRSSTASGAGGACGR